MPQVAVLGRKSFGVLEFASGRVNKGVKIEPPESIYEYQ